MDNAEISAEQLEQWSKQADRGELPDEALEQVAGGLAGTTILAICLGVYAGTQIAAGIASIFIHRW